MAPGGLKVATNETPAQFNPRDVLQSWGIDLHQAVCGLDRSSYPAAQREIFGQHFFSALKRELGPVDALPGIGNFRCQKIGCHPVAVGFHSVHGFLIHGGRYRSLMSGETAGRRKARWAE
ncbi:hypothetical protein NKH93_30120 [Mesorhizobium sp. M0954]|uniref:hypothetical protein n=1 Tax=Mesorhizobium sp. M0954 TaxID=2957032 RepID=UPI0033381332